MPKLCHKMQDNAVGAGGIGVGLTAGMRDLFKMMDNNEEVTPMIFVMVCLHFHIYFRKFIKI